MNNNQKTTNEQVDINVLQETIESQIKSITSQRKGALYQIQQITKAMSMEDNAYMMESHMKNLNRHHVDFQKYDSELKSYLIMKHQISGY